MPFYNPEQIASFTHRDLQIECKHVGLNAGGSTSVLRQRLRTWSDARLEEEYHHDDDEPGAKKLKQSNVADDLICPITHEWPFEPVTAEDGRIYERWAIEAHFTARQGHGLKSLPSPTTPWARSSFPLPNART